MTLNQTTPVSSPFDTLKALVLHNISMLEYVQDQLGGGYEVEDLQECLDSLIAGQHAAIFEHLPSRKVEWANGVVFDRLPDEAHVYDDGSPVVEYFDGHGITSSYYPRYDGNRDLALSRHYKSVAEMNLRFSEEMQVSAEGREWPPAEETDAEGVNESALDQ